MTRARFASLFILGAALASPLLAQEDPVLTAMKAEIERSKSLALPGVDKPYFIEYSMDESNSYSVVATLGAVISSGEQRFRIPRVQIRVGTPEFDNTNYVFSDFFGGRGGGGRIPLDGDVAGLRRYFWLASDSAYKGALESIARKRAALRNVTVQDSLPDFSSAPAAQRLEPASGAKIDAAAWTRRAREISAVFQAFPALVDSQVSVQAAAGFYYMANSEGSALRLVDDLFSVNIRAAGQAADGMPVRDSAVLSARVLESLPSEEEMRKVAEATAQNVVALVNAPLGEDYSGPVLFEDIASPQIFAQLLGNQLSPSRRPVMEPGRQFPAIGSELEGKKGSRVLPDWMDVVDDPTQESYRGRRLFGSYPVDMEGVAPKPLKLVDGGVLSGYFYTRQPVRGHEGSNGRARLPGAFGARIAVFSNLFVSAKETVAKDEMKKRLLSIVEQRGKPYGIIVRKLDFPAIAPQDEIRKLAEAAGQRSGRAVSLPTLIYKVYPDGREELVRGLRFRGVSSRSLRDIVAASDEEVFFSFLHTGNAMASAGGSSFVTTCTIVAPSVLFEEMEFEKRTDDWPKLPLVPAPALTSQR
jgi:hypothetical protein